MFDLNRGWMQLQNVDLDDYEWHAEEPKRQQRRIQCLVTLE